MTWVTSIYSVRLTCNGDDCPKYIRTDLNPGETQFHAMCRTWTEVAEPAGWTATSTRHLCPAEEPET